MVEEIDLDIAIFGTSEALWPWRWPWIGSRSYWCAYLSRSTHRPHYIKTEKKFCGRMDGRTHLTSVSLLGHHLSMT